MIRFIYIGGQITEDSTDFAFYDTVTDRILDFAGTQVFGSIDELQECLSIERERGNHNIDEGRLYALISVRVKL